MSELKPFNPKCCVNCGCPLMDAYDRDPNGDPNCVCAKCRAEDKHDFDKEPGVVFDRAGHRIIDPIPRMKVVIEAPAHAVKKLLEGWKNKDPRLLEMMKEFGVVDIVPHKEGSHDRNTQSS